MDAVSRAPLREADVVLQVGHDLHQHGSGECDQRLAGSNAPASDHARHVAASTGMVAIHRDVGRSAMRQAAHEPGRIDDMLGEVSSGICMQSVLKSVAAEAEGGHAPPCLPALGAVRRDPAQL